MQGFNMGRYRAPADLDRSLEPGRTASRLSKGPVQDTIRFEMPFDIRCTTCPPSSIDAPIRQGVRFNAVKKKVGNYYSTPVWSFRMKHTVCGAWFEIRTDPQNHDFVVVEGATKRNFGEDAIPVDRSDEAVLRRLDPRISDEQKAKDAFAAFESKTADATRARSDAHYIEDLKALRDRDWRDPDAVNRRLRDRFRAGRRAREAQAKHDEEIVARYNFSVDLLPPSEDDAKHASLVQYGAQSEESAVQTSNLRLYRKPFLKGDKTPKPSSGRAGAFRDEVLANTRAATDPFDAANAKHRSVSKSSLGLKRKREHSMATTKDNGIEPQAAAPSSGAVNEAPAPLVEYDGSDWE